MDLSKVVVDTARKSLSSIYSDFETQESTFYDAEEASEIIESIILRLPLPSFILAEDQNGGWCNASNSNTFDSIRGFVDGKYALIDLTVYKNLNGNYFNDLPRNIQRRIEDTQVVIHTIDHTVPEDIKVNIISRMNDMV